MHTITQNTIKLIAVLLLVTAMFGAGPAPSIAHAACTPDISFALYAKTGSTTLYPGSPSINIWGFSGGPTGATDPAALPGPILDVDAGDCVGVTLNNVDIPGATSLLFQGQSMVPDTVGVGAGGSVTYTFMASDPGTYLYEAGLTPNGQVQVAMGLYGALIVRPAAADQAYDDPSTAFDTETILVLSELDSTLSNSATPNSFDIRNYKPKYFLINGKAYPGTVEIPASPGDRLLLRYVNAGLTSHSMGVLGLSQKVIAEDGNAFQYPHSMTSESIAAGATLDAISAISASTSPGTKYTLYDSNMMLRNNSGLNSFVGFGGMITFINVGTPVGPGPDATGPGTSNISLPSGAVAGATNVPLSASVSDVATGNSNVTAAEYFIDVTGTNGTGSTMSGTFGSPGPIAVTAIIPDTVVGGLSTGNHTVYVHGLDSAGNWGSFALGILRVDNIGPYTSTLGLSPNPANGSVDVTLSATGNDAATGNSNIAAAEYFIDAVGTTGLGFAMSVNIASPVASVSASIPAATVLSLSEGPHDLYVHSKDALNNWGPIATVVLTVDKTGPTASSVNAAPNPNNGTLPFNSSVQAVRVTAALSDVPSGNANVVAAEGFIDTIGTTGTGFVFIANDGVFNSPTESGYADVPLVVINALSSGNHTIYVHGRDSAGNWGAMGTVTLVIDRTAPAIVSIDRVDPDPTTAASVNFLVTFSEDVTGVTSSNFGLVQTGGLTGAAITSVSGTGATRTVTVTTGSGAGTLGLNLTVATGIKDLAMNALPSTGLPFVGQIYTIPSSSVSLYFSTTGNTNPPAAGGSADDADIYFWNGSAFSRSIDVSAMTNPLPAGANADGFDRISATQFYMSFNAAVTVPGIAGTVEDEDIVMRNGTTWTLYFDGSANGLTTGGFDLDAISIVGAGGPGNVYFSTDNGNVPPGAGGTGDDADIYRWNGGSSYTRVVDANGAGSLGLPTGANVDGVVWVDSTHFYMSFGADTTVPGLGTVQDEDVVYYSAGTWSVYFDGTAQGLIIAALDVDAFDLP